VIVVMPAPNRQPSSPQRYVHYPLADMRPTGTNCVTFTPSHAAPPHQPGRMPTQPTTHTCTTAPAPHRTNRTGPAAQLPPAPAPSPATQPRTPPPTFCSILPPFHHRRIRDRRASLLAKSDRRRLVANVFPQRLADIMRAFTSTHASLYRHHVLADCEGRKQRLDDALAQWSVTSHVIIHATTMQD